MSDQSSSDSTERADDESAAAPKQDSVYSTQQASDEKQSTVDVDADPIAAERDAYKETLQRLQADFENYRKRVQKQQAEAMERANESLVQKLLPVLDTLDLAKAHDPSGSLEQVSGSLLDVLTKEGLERVEAVDQMFDPTLHEAVAHEPGEGEPKVGEELRAGYRWKGRVIRPAMVKVVG